MKFLLLQQGNKCGGNPFYIDAVIHQAAEQNIKDALIKEVGLRKLS